MYMETNETILTRDVVVIDSHKKMGSVRALRVDCDAMAVSHYLVNNDSTGSALVLPFEKALAVGDTFITVQNRDDFLAVNDAYSNKVTQEGYALLGAPVFTKTGNRLEPVKSFEFDTVHGTVTRIFLNDGASYASQTFLFFTPEFVFIDDGAPTAAEIRSGSAATGSAEATLPPPTGEAVVEVFASPEPDASEESTITDEEIVDFLIGATLQADVESEDGQFKVSKGTELTREHILQAADHDAILLLTINVAV